MADLLSILQPAIGALLFVACGWALTLALFKEGDIDAIERVAFGMAFALVIPALVLLFMNLVLQIKISTLLVFAVYAVLAVGSWVYAEKKLPRLHVLQA
ncbi:MAG: hypothetical protein NTY90_03630 [Candidatus Micrarchaeota archaeon]|nr:hypothetical protein [Candidatus Micrarchaeota archaeon]